VPPSALVREWLGAATADDVRDGSVEWVTALGKTGVVGARLAASRASARGARSGSARMARRAAEPAALDQAHGMGSGTDGRCGGRPGRLDVRLAIAGTAREVGARFAPLTGYTKVPRRVWGASRPGFYPGHRQKSRAQRSHDRARRHLARGSEFLLASQPLIIVLPMG